MNLERAAELLQEFNYERNGKIKTIKFLAYILNGLINGGKDE